MDFAASVFCQATHHEGHVQTVPRVGKGGIRRGEFSAMIAAVEQFLFQARSLSHLAHTVIGLFW